MAVDPFIEEIQRLVNEWQNRAERTEAYAEKLRDDHMRYHDAMRMHGVAEGLRSCAAQLEYKLEREES